MYPTLVKFHNFEITTFGLMMFLAFIVAGWVLTRQFRRYGLSDDVASSMVMAAAIGGIAGAKVLSEFARENELFVIRAGAMSNALMSAKDIKALALLPSRQELLAKLLGTLQAPIVKLVRTMNEVPARFVRTLAAYRDAKEKAAA